MGTGCALFIGLSSASNAICLAFPWLFSLTSLPNFHPKTLHQGHNIQDGITLCARTCKEPSKQIVPVHTSSGELCSGFTAHISADFNYSEYTVAQEAKPSVDFPMEQLAALGRRSE